MLIKYILIAIIVLIIWRITSQFRRGGLHIREYLLWLMFWFGGIFIILRPETATLAANLVGIGRGADFIVYISVIIVFYLVYRILVRQEKMEKEITKIVREISIVRARTPNKLNQNEENPTN